MEIRALRTAAFRIANRSLNDRKGGRELLDSNAPHFGRSDRLSDYPKAAGPLKSSPWQQIGGLHTGSFEH
jgi:hypothetical protein